MDKEKVVKIGQKLINTINYPNRPGVLSECKNLISNYCGKNNIFYQEIEKIEWENVYAFDNFNALIRSFLNSVEDDLISKASHERKIKIEVVGEFLDQAEGLLQDNKFHPAVSSVLIGASLEEFLRNWVFDENISMENKKLGIDTYATQLKSFGLIDKQDYKDITSWAGLRNDAAHGHWDLVNDKEKIGLMLQGVSLFIKKYSN